MSDSYFTIQKPGEAEFKDRGSKFLAFAFPANEIPVFKTRLVQLKKEHPKAVHHCFAYRMGTTGNIFRVSDDGEPSGTAGKPILGQLDSRNITDAAIVVVRYFGGTLLGVPGLIYAYKTVASLSLQVTPVIQKQVEVPYLLQFDYTRINDVMVILKLLGCNIIEQDLQLFCMIKVSVPLNRVKEFIYNFSELRVVEVIAI